MASIRPPACAGDEEETNAPPRCCTCSVLSTRRRRVWPFVAAATEQYGKIPFEMPIHVILDSSIPIADCDPYSDEVLASPWAMYSELRALGAAVWLRKYAMFALTRYASVEWALKDATTFSSASGVMMNDEMNQVLRGNTLCSDGADHQRLRRIIAQPLYARALQSLRDQIAAKAEQVVQDLVARKTFCAVADLAVPLPVDIVATAVGLPQAGRERMLSWGEQLFHGFVPLNDRSRHALPVLREMLDYATTQAVRGKLKTGFWD
jgi:cytochrome P450